MACSTLCFMCGNMSHAWRMLNKGTLHQEGDSVFAIERFQCVVDQVGAVLLAVRDQVPITDRLFFCPSLSCVRVHVCWLRGVPCNKLLRVVERGSNALFQRASLLQQLICHVEAYLEGVLSDMQVVLFVVDARTVVTEISC